MALTFSEGVAIGYVAATIVTFCLARPQLCPRCHYQTWLEKIRGGGIKDPRYKLPGFLQWVKRLWIKWTTLK